MSEVFTIYGEGLWKKEVGEFSIYISHKKIQTCCGVKEDYCWAVLKGKKEDIYNKELVAGGSEKTLEEAKKAVEKYV